MGFVYSLKPVCDRLYLYADGKPQEPQPGMDLQMGKWCAGI